MSSKVKCFAVGVVMVGLICAVGCNGEKDKYEFDLMFAGLFETSHPNVGDIFKNDSGLITVRDKSSNGIYSLRSITSVAAGLIAGDYEYCHGEHLRKGFYKYQGNSLIDIEEEYELNGEVRTRTVGRMGRIFKEVPECEFRKFVQRKKGTGR